MSKPIYPCLWFVDNARQAADFYCSIFKTGKIIEDNGMVVIFELSGMKFMGLNGGDLYTHTPAISFVIDCKNQEEIDHFWDKLGEGGRYDMCGWLQDKYGISWQVVPEILGTLMADPEKGPRVVQAFLKMQKFDIETLMNA